jgi:hypothetical protein
MDKIWRKQFVSESNKEVARRAFWTNKKIMVVAPTAHITTPKGNARTFVNLGVKFFFKFCRAGGPGRTFDAPGSNLFTGGFFLLLRERKRITVIFFIISFF